MSRHRVTGLSGSWIGAEYDEEEKELLKAADAYRIKTGKAFLPCTEVLGILRSLGWRKNSPIDVNR